jgi:hypothetical protein
MNEQGLAPSEQEHCLPGFHHVYDDHISTVSVTIQLPGQVGITLTTERVSRL